MSPRFLLVWESIVFLAMGVAASVASASRGDWRLIGPPGGNAEVLVPDPRQPATIYAGGRSGICRSRDGGRTWTPIINGLTHRSVRSIAVDPTDSSRLWVGTHGGGLFRSVDAGEHWLDANGGLRPIRQRWWGMSVWTIAIHPTQPETMLIGVETVQEHTPQADFAGGIFKSIDGGRTWNSPKGFPLTRVSALAFDPKDPSVLYAGTFRCGILKSTDGGETWLRLATTGSLDVRALRVAPTDPTTIYAATLTAGVYRSIDGGTTWHPTNAGLTDAYAMDVLVDPEDPQRILSATAYDGVFESLDGGGHWNWTSPFLRGAGVQAVMTTTNTDGVLAGTFNNGVFRCDRPGAEWVASSNGLTTSGVDQLVRARAPDYIVVRGWTVWANSPMGWSIRGALPSGTCSGGVIHGTSDPKRLYAQGCGNWKSDDGGATWSRLSPPTVEAPGVLAVDPLSPNRLYAASLGALLLSEDAGFSWRRLGAPGVHPEELLVEGAARSRLWLRSTTSLLQSNDGGQTWRHLELPVEGAIQTFIVSSPTKSILVTIMGTGLFRSVDDGTTWQLVLEREVHAAGVDPASGRHLVAAVRSSTERFGEYPSSDVLESLDAGQTWNDITGNLRSELTSITFDPAAGKIVVAGSQGLATLPQNPESLKSGETSR